MLLKPFFTICLCRSPATPRNARAVTVYAPRVSVTTCLMASAPTGESLNTDTSQWASAAGEMVKADDELLHAVSTLLLPQKQRYALWALYAWARRADEIGMGL